MRCNMKEIKKLFNDPKNIEIIKGMQTYFDCYTQYYPTSAFKDELIKYEQIINSATYLDVFKNDDQEEAAEDYIPNLYEVADEKCAHLEKDLSEEQQNLISTYHYFQIENGEAAYERTVML